MLCMYVYILKLGKPSKIYNFYKEIEKEQRREKIMPLNNDRQAF